GSSMAGLAWLARAGASFEAGVAQKKTPRGEPRGATSNGSGGRAAPPPLFAADLDDAVEPVVEIAIDLVVLVAADQSAAGGKPAAAGIARDLSAIDIHFDRAAALQA